jgi:isoquinoline 1-oxidoreductase beta subunit
MRNTSRRQFLQQTGCLSVGFYLGSGLRRAAAADLSEPQMAALFAPNAFVRIAPDNSVTVIAKHLEMGQGTFTGLPTLLAEELDADWAQVRVEAAPADAKRYTNSLMGMQLTGGSTAIANSHEQLRMAGATARALLVAAAAQDWRVPADEITVSAGIVSHEKSKRKARFGALVRTASSLPAPTGVKLKDPSQFKLIGNAQLRRKDSSSKTEGSATFTQDVKLPDMLVAVPAHPPRFGATVKSFDASAAKAVPGVVAVVQFPGGTSRFEGVAVLAKNTWVAKKGRDALKIEWDDSQAFKLGTAEIFAKYRQLAGQPGFDGPQRRRYRNGAGRRMEGPGGRLRISLSRACPDGTIELRGAFEFGSL